MSELPVIPTAPGQRWREFRLRVAPAVVFVLALATTITLWRSYVVPPTLVGEVESSFAEVRAPEDGTVSNLMVVEFQEVEMGADVTILSTVDPRTQETRSDVIRRELQLLNLMSRHPELDQQRNLLDFERLQLDLHSEQMALATARTNLVRAESEHRRNLILHQQQVVADRVLETSQAARDVLMAEVNQRSNTIELLTSAVLQRKKDLDFAVTNLSVEANAMRAKRMELQQQSRSPLVLKAPIAGSISAVHRRPGENVSRGETLVTIRSSQPERIIGFIRQPFPFEPTEGMMVKVRTRSVNRSEGWAEVKSVGTQLQQVIPTLARPGVTAEVGLPIAVSIPPELQLRPGELVDLILTAPGTTPLGKNSGVKHAIATP